MILDLGKVNAYTVRFCNKPQGLTLSLTLTQIGVNIVNLTFCDKSVIRWIMKTVVTLRDLSCRQESRAVITCSCTLVKFP